MPLVNFVRPMTEGESFFRGLQKTSVIDFPKKIAAVLFVGGCNFRCPYCYNVSLVEKTAPCISWEEVFAFLLRRQKILDGLCVSGGEPTLVPFLTDFLRKVKSMGYLVKLDTNGYRPEVLRELLHEGLLDYVAMDVKNSPQKYTITSGVFPLDLQLLKTSIELIKAAGVDYEFRTTLSTELVSLADIDAMADFVGGGKTFALQAVSSTHSTLSGRKFTPPNQAALQEMRQALATRFQEVVVRAM